MNAAAHMSTLYPLLPEIVLGLGAMALLMLGAYGDARTARVIDGLAIALLIAAGVILYLLPAGKLVSFNGSFVVDNFPASSKFWPWPAPPPLSPCRSITPSMR